MAAVNLPKRVRIGYRSYRVVEWPEHEARAAGRYGETDRLSHVIRIQVRGVPVNQAAETLLHEIMHCIYEGQGVHQGDDEERTVSAVSIGLASAMVSNPDVFAWIAKRIRPL